MPYTRTDIGNEALLLVGELPIEDIEAADSSTARTVLGFWDSTARKCQSETFWPECIRRIEISEDPSLSLDGLHRYAIPGDSLRIKSINPPCGDAYRTEGHYIVTPSASPIVLEYSAYLPDPGEWSEHLAECVQVLLASKLAIPLAHSAQMAAALREQYSNETLPSARRRVYADHRSVEVAPRYYGWRRARR